MINIIIDFFNQKNIKKYFLLYLKNIKKIIKKIIINLIILFYRNQIYTNPNKTIKSSKNKINNVLKYVGYVFTIVNNEYFNIKIFNFFKDVYKDDRTKRVLYSVINALVSLLSNYLFYKIIFKKNIINNFYIRKILLSLFFSTFYSLLISPLLSALTKNKKLNTFINKFVNDLLYYINNDFMTDGILNELNINFYLSIISSLLNIIFNEILDI